MQRSEAWEKYPMKEENNIKERVLEDLNGTQRRVAEYGEKKSEASHGEEKLQEGRFTRARRGHDPVMLKPRGHRDVERDRCEQ